MENVDPLKLGGDRNVIFQAHKCVNDLKPWFGEDEDEDEATCLPNAYLSVNLFCVQLSLEQT